MAAQDIPILGQKPTPRMAPLAVFENQNGESFAMPQVFCAALNDDVIAAIAAHTTYAVLAALEKQRQAEVETAPLPVETGLVKKN